MSFDGIHAEPVPALLVDRFALAVTRIVDATRLLFVDPVKYTRDVALSLGTIPSALLGMLAGLSFAIEIVGKDLSDPSMSWGAWWIRVLPGAVGGGLMIVLLAEPLFRFKAYLAGAAVLPLSSSRRTTVILALIPAIPVLVIQIGASLVYGSPLEARNALETTVLVVGLVMAIKEMRSEVRILEEVFGARRARLVVYGTPVVFVLFVLGLFHVIS